MALDSLVGYPANRTYVLKLHREADGDGGRLWGRLENIATGRSVHFRNADELLQGLASDMDKTLQILMETK